MYFQSQPHFGRNNRIQGAKFIIDKDECIYRNYVFYTQDVINDALLKSTTFWENIFREFTEETMKLRIVIRKG